MNVSKLQLLVLEMKAYLKRLEGRCGEGLFRVSRWTNTFFVGDVRDVVPDVEVLSLYFRNSSPIFAFLNAIGMRLTRISMRVRSP